jgi:hypothetical protein
MGGPPFAFELVTPTVEDDITLAEVAAAAAWYLDYRRGSYLTLWPDFPQLMRRIQPLVSSTIQRTVSSISLSSRRLLWMRF